MPGKFFTYSLLIYLVSVTVNLKADPLPFITLNFKGCLAIFPKKPEIANGTALSQNITGNKGYFFDIGFKLSERLQLFTGRQYLTRNYKIVYPPQKFGLAYIDHRISIASTPISLSYLMSNQKKTKLFYVQRLMISTVNEDVKAIYNDSMPPSPYASRNRQLSEKYRALCTSFGVGIEHQLFIKEIFVMFQAEYALELAPRVNQTTSFSRLSFNAGLSFKIY